MGLTSSSVGKNAIDTDFIIQKRNPDDFVVALAGNPNVGKSTIFNALTGLNQHTGNWPGKTISNAQGYFSTEKNSYVFVDIPGTYSLMAHSPEEEVARDFICFGKPDAIIIVCDATCLERNMNLVLQTLEITNKVIVCINLMDEAKRKGIEIDVKKLSEILGVPVVCTVARKKKSLKELTNKLDELVNEKKDILPFRITYPDEIENAISVIEPIIAKTDAYGDYSRWISLRLIDSQKAFKDKIRQYFNIGESISNELSDATGFVRASLNEKNNVNDLIVSTVVSEAEKISCKVINNKSSSKTQRDEKIDKLLTSKLTGYPIMFILFMIIFWISIKGANYPSIWLSKVLFSFEDVLSEIFIYFDSPEWLRAIIVDGGYRVLAWVVSVMLPPMAIFFPLFTLLEDSGYLPRIAYNLDKPFKRCNACGKQALTMCMGFGCNAAGVVGARIIDSPRERLLAIISNSLVPCNGRFPTLITLITVFFLGNKSGLFPSIFSAFFLCLFIVLSIFITFIITKILSVTFLKGMASSFTLELPPYRKPQLLKVIVRSIFDRTLYVLGRAASVAAPVGVIIWLFANVRTGQGTLLSLCSDFFDPFAKLMGLDGVILMSFILAFPANEIVMPIIIMTYLSNGTLTELTSLSDIYMLFVSHGWTWTTAVCMILFSLMHWPCSTTLITIKKETGSIKWTALSFIIPTLCGIISCIIFNLLSKMLF